MYFLGEIIDRLLQIAFLLALILAIGGMLLVMIAAVQYLIS